MDSTVFAPRLYVKYSWLGHRHTIRTIHQVANNRLCTIGTDGEINVWKYGFREVKKKIKNKKTKRGCYPTHGTRGREEEFRYYYCLI